MISSDPNGSDFFWPGTSRRNERTRVASIVRRRRVREPISSGERHLSAMARRATAEARRWISTRRRSRPQKRSPANRRAQTRAKKKSGPGGALPARCRAKREPPRPQNRPRPRTIFVFQSKNWSTTASHLGQTKFFKSYAHRACEKNGGKFALKRILGFTLYPNSLLSVFRSFGFFAASAVHQPLCLFRGFTRR